MDVLFRCISLAEKEIWLREPIFSAELNVNWTNQCMANDGRHICIANIEGKGVLSTHCCYHQS